MTSKNVFLFLSTNIFPSISPIKVLDCLMSHSPIYIICDITVIELSYLNQPRRIVTESIFISNYIVVSICCRKYKCFKTLCKTIFAFTQDRKRSLIQRSCLPIHEYFLEIVTFIVELRNIFLIRSYMKTFHAFISEIENLSVISNICLNGIVVYSYITYLITLTIVVACRF